MISHVKILIMNNNRCLKFSCYKIFELFYERNERFQTCIAIKLVWQVNLAMLHWITKLFVRTYGTPW